MTSARSDLLANGLAVLARLGSGTALFVVLGRLLGPASFGDLMSAMAVATLLAFLSNLGLSQQVLREVAAQAGQPRNVAAELMSAKLTLALVMAVVAILVGVVGGGNWWVLAALTLALVCDGLVEFLFALLKAHGRYGAEAGFATAGAVVHLILVAAVCVYSRSVLHVAWVFALSRAMQLGVAVIVCRGQMALPRAALSLHGLWRQAREGWAYALDVGLGQLTAQLDTVIVRVMLGAHAAGMYQAGMRVVIGMLTLSVVAGNVFIPRLARSMADPAAHQQVVRQLGKTYGAMAVVSALGVLGLGALFTQYGYGAAYSELWALWPWLAGLVAVRVLAANHGVRLTAMGQQAMRSVVNMVALAVAVGLMLLAAMAGAGLPGVVGALITSSVVVWAVYRHRVRQLEAA